MYETKRFCEYLVLLRQEDIPEDVIKDARYRVLDWTGCAISALSSETGQKLLAFARKSEGCGAFPVIGLSGRYPEETAALVNGVLGHISEYDDVSKLAIGHPGSVVIPAALLAAKEYRCTVGEFLTAIVCGYEAFIRLGRAVCPSHYDSWHTTGTIGAFAAAAAAAKIAKLSVGEMRGALGITATMASGLIASFGSDAKVITVGNAVENGLTATRLAQAGIGGPMDTLENRDSFFYITSKDYDSEKLLEDLGRAFLITTAGYKIHASCGHTHTVLDALLSLVREHDIRGEEILSMKTEVYSVAGRLTSALKMATEQEAKFSLPYCMAAAAICGEVSMPQFTKEMRQRADILSLAKRTSVAVNPNYDAGYPAARTCQVWINTSRGEFERALRLPVQIPDETVLRRKFDSIARGGVPSQWLDTACKQILFADLEKPANEIADMILEVGTWQAV